MIDWFTVIAQIVNFLVLIGLLRYFLYDRVMQAIDQRQQDLTARWEDAEEKRRNALQELQSAKQKNEQFDLEREMMLAAAHEEVSEQRKELTAKLRTEIDEVRGRWRTAVAEETESFLQAVRLQVAEKVCQVAQQALSDLATEKLDTLIVEHFLDEIECIEEPQRKAIVNSLQANPVVTVQTTYELTADLQTHLEQKLRDTFGTDLRCEFDVSKELICGIALHTNSHKLAWDVSSYLATFESDLRQLLREEVVPHDQRKPEFAETAGTQ